MSEFDERHSSAVVHVGLLKAEARGARSRGPSVATLHLVFKCVCLVECMFSLCAHIEVCRSLVGISCHVWNCNGALTQSAVLNRVCG